MEEKIFTTEELADYWKVSYNTVNVLLRRGDLAGFKICGSWRIPLSAVKKYEKDNTAIRQKVKIIKDEKGRYRVVT